MDLTSHSSTAMSFVENQHGYTVLSRLFDQKLGGRFCDVIIHVKERSYLAHRCVLASCSAYFENILKDKKSAMENVNINSSQHEIFQIVLDYMYTGKVMISKTTVGEILRMANYFMVQKLKSYCSEYLERNLHPGNCYFVKDTADKWDLPKLAKTAHAFILANIAQVVDQQEITKFDEQKMDNLLGDKSCPMTEDLRFHAICHWINGDTMTRYKSFDKLLVHIQWSRFNIQTLYNLVQSEKLFAESEWCMFRILSMLQEQNLLLPVYVESMKFLADKIERGENVEATHEKRETEKVKEKEREDAKRTEQEATAEREARETLLAADIQEDEKFNDVPNDLPHLMNIGDCTTVDIENSQPFVNPTMTPDTDMALLIQSTVIEAQQPVPNYVKIEPQAASEKSGSDNEDGFVGSSVELQNSNDEFTFAEEPADASSDFTAIPELIVVKPKEEPKHKRKGQPVKLRISKSRITPIAGHKKRGRPSAYTKISKKYGNSGNANGNVEQETNALKTMIMKLPPQGHTQIEVEAKNIVNIMESKWKHQNKQTSSDRGRRRRSSVDKPRGFKQGRYSEKQTNQNPADQTQSLHDETLLTETAERKSTGSIGRKRVISADKRKSVKLADVACSVTKAKRAKKMNVKRKPRERRDSKSHRKLKDKEERCEHCSYIAEDETALVAHMELCELASNVTHACNICDYTSAWNKRYLGHMITHFDGSPFRCDFEGCDHTTERIQSLLQHRMRHTDERPYACTQCDLKFRTKNNLHTHMRCHTGEKPWMCEVCNRCFATKGTLEQHSVTHSEIRPYLCDTCGFSTKYQSHLIAHKRIHTGDVFRCQFPRCNYSTPKRSQLACHMRSHMSIRQHICSVCSRAFVEKSHLVRHERIHLDDKPFKCDSCDYSSTRRDKLKEHVEKYHGEGSKCKTSYKPRKSRRPNQNDAHFFAYNQTSQRELEFNERMEKAVQMNHTTKHETGIELYNTSKPLHAQTNLINMSNVTTQNHDVSTKEETEADMTQLKAAILQTTDLSSLTSPTAHSDIIIQAAMSSAISTVVSQSNDTGSNMIPITLDQNSHNMLATNPLAVFAMDPRLMQSQNLAMIGAQSPHSSSLVVSSDNQDRSGQLHGFQVAPVCQSQTQPTTSATDLTQLHGLMGMLGNMANI